VLYNDEMTDVGVPHNSPSHTPFDVEMGNVIPPTASNGANILAQLRGITDRLDDTANGFTFNRADAPPRPPSTTNSVPEGMKEWWSTQIFRVVMFFLFCFGVFGVATAMTFQKVMSIDQYLGVVSSLLFLLSPSPLDLLKNKKKPV
jgi:hypothetical protein